MAKKLKYPYEQWKQGQEQEQKSRSPSPMQNSDLERSHQLASSASESGQLTATHSKSIFACKSLNIPP